MKTKLFVINIEKFYKAFLMENDYDLEITKIQYKNDLIFITLEGSPLGLFWLGYNFGAY